MKTIIALISMLAVSASAQLIPAGRTIDWTQAGIPGGIPVRNTIFVNVLTTSNPSYKCAGDGVTDDSGALHNAIVDCPSNQVVYLPTARYFCSDYNGLNFTSPLRYKTVRGDGQGKTVIINAVPEGGYFWSFDVGGNTDYAGYGSPPNYNGFVFPIVSGYTQGSSNIVTLGGMTNSGAVWAPGNLMFISQFNDTNNGVSSFGGNGCGTFFDITQDCTHAISQMVKITAITNGTNLTFWPPLNYTYTAGLVPEVFFVNGASFFTGQDNTLSKLFGIEDLTITNSVTNSAAPQKTIYMDTANQCWIHNVEIIGMSANGEHAGIYMSRTLQCQIDGCHFHSPISFYQSYNVQLDHSMNFLFYDNIMEQSYQQFEMAAGSQGSVVAYNLCTNQIQGPIGPGQPADNAYLDATYGANHGAHPMFNLYEGNVGARIQCDWYWGSCSYLTILRNNIIGTDNGISENQYAMSLDAYARNINVIDNIIGCPNVTWTASHMVGEPGTTDGSAYCWRVGYPNAGNNAFTGTNVPMTVTGWQSSFDTNVLATMFQVENFNYFDNSVQNTTNVSIPASLYLSGKPAWFGTCPWPPFDATNTAHSAVTNIPAGYRFVFGVNPPTSDPFISVQPQNASVTVGQTANFTVTAGGQSSLTYQWAKTGTPISGATQSSYTTPATSFGDNGSTFAVTVTDNAGSLMSSSATLTVTNASGAPFSLIIFR